jgi:hypothetical protein
MSRSYEHAQARAMASPGYDPTHASASDHARDMWPAPNRRRKCHCGCGGRITHVGGANAIALMSGCELSVRRWVRDGYGRVPTTANSQEEA